MSLILLDLTKWHILCVFIKARAEQARLTMKWIEIIRIRSAEDRWADLNHHVQAIMDKMDMDRNIDSVMVYRHLLDRDLSIHLCWGEGEPLREGSKIGLCLVHLFKEFGLVSHSVWLMEKNRQGRESEVMLPPGNHRLTINT